MNARFEVGIAFEWTGGTRNSSVSEVEQVQDRQRTTVFLTVFLG